MFTSKFFELVTKAVRPCAKVFLGILLFLLLSLFVCFTSASICWNLVETACVVEFLFFRTLLSRI